MIKVTVELYPFGGEKNSEVLSTALIWNDGTSPTKRIGNYEGVVVDNKGKVVRCLRVEDFKRLDRGVWELIERALRGR